MDSLWGFRRNSFAETLARRRRRGPCPVTRPPLEPDCAPVVFWRRCAPSRSIGRPSRPARRTAPDAVYAVDERVAGPDPSRGGTRAHPGARLSIRLPPRPPPTAPTASSLEARTTDAPLPSRRPRRRRLGRRREQCRLVDRGAAGVHRHLVDRQRRLLRPAARHGGAPRQGPGAQGGRLQGLPRQGLRLRQQLHPQHLRPRRRARLRRRRPRQAPLGQRERLLRGPRPHLLDRILVARPAQPRTQAGLAVQRRLALRRQGGRARPPRDARRVRLRAGPRLRRGAGQGRQGQDDGAAQVGHHVLPLRPGPRQHADEHLLCRHRPGRVRLLFRGAVGPRLRPRRAAQAGQRRPRQRLRHHPAHRRARLRLGRRLLQPCRDQRPRLAPAAQLQPLGRHLELLQRHVCHVVVVVCSVAARPEGLPLPRLRRGPRAPELGRREPAD